MNEHEDQACITQAQEDLISFAYMMNPQFICGKHHDIIAKTLKRTLTEKNLRTIITAPPRHGKSHLVSEIFPAWYMGHRPSNKMILTAYGQDLASDFGSQVKNNIDSQEFQSVFPDVELSKDSKSKKTFRTNQGGTYFAVGRGGAINGKGAACLIIDDPLKNEKEAESELIRKQCIDWYKRTLYTRLMPGGSIIVMATRWHESDLIGHLIDDPSEEWEIINLPAINEEGEALWPEWFPIKELERIKKVLGTRAFASLYQQNPMPAEGNIIKRANLKFYSKLPKESLEQMDEVIFSWDMAFKDKDNSDFVVGSVYARYRGNFYLIDQVRDKMNFPATLKAFINLCSKYPMVVTKLVEDKANGTAVIAVLKDKIPGIIEVEPDASKVSRVNAISPVYESGNVYYPTPEIAPWINDHVEEIVGFPFAKYDDRMDAESQAIKRLMGNCSDTEMYEDIESYIKI